MLHTRCLVNHFSTHRLASTHKLFDSPLRKTNTVLNSVPSSEVHILERFGRYRATVDKGLYWAIPLVDRILRVEQREIDVEVFSRQSSSTDEMRNVGVLTVKITDPIAFVYNSQKPLRALRAAAQTAISAPTIDGDELRSALGHCKETYGIDIVRCEVHRSNRVDEWCLECSDELRSEYVFCRNYILGIVASVPLFFLVTGGVMVVSL